MCPGRAHEETLRHGCRIGSGSVTYRRFNQGMLPSLCCVTTAWAVNRMPGTAAGLQFTDFSTGFTGSTFPASISTDQITYSLVATSLSLYQRRTILSIPDLTDDLRASARAYALRCVLDLILYDLIQTKLRC